MIRQNDREITAIYHLGRAVTAVYHMGRIVWQAVRSCFGRGVWMPAKPWIDTDKWKNNP